MSKSKYVPVGLKTVEVHGMCCPYCGSLRFTDNEDTPEVSRLKRNDGSTMLVGQYLPRETITYRCGSCGGYWHWSPRTQIQTYDNGNAGTTKRKLVITEDA